MQDFPHPSGRQLSEEAVQRFVREVVSDLPEALIAGRFSDWLSDYEQKVAAITKGWTVAEMRLFDALATAEIRTIRLEMREGRGLMGGFAQQQKSSSAGFMGAIFFGVIVFILLMALGLHKR